MKNYLFSFITAIIFAVATYFYSSSLLISIISLLLFIHLYGIFDEGPKALLKSLVTLPLLIFLFRFELLVFIKNINYSLITFVLLFNLILAYITSRLNQ